MSLFVSRLMQWQHPMDDGQSFVRAQRSLGEGVQTLQTEITHLNIRPDLQHLSSREVDEESNITLNGNGGSSINNNNQEVNAENR